MPSGHHQRMSNRQVVGHSDFDIGWTPFDQLNWKACSLDELSIIGHWKTSPAIESGSQDVCAKDLWSERFPEVGTIDCMVNRDLGSGCLVRVNLSFDGSPESRAKNGGTRLLGCGEDICQIAIADQRASRIMNGHKGNLAERLQRRVYACHAFASADDKLYTKLLQRVVASGLPVVQIICVDRDDNGTYFASTSQRGGSVLPHHPPRQGCENFLGGACTGSARGLIGSRKPAALTGRRKNDCDGTRSVGHRRNRGF